MIDARDALDRIHARGTIFFDRDLQPIVPQPGQWFAEFDGDHEGLYGEAIVEYIGPCDAVVWDDQQQAFVHYGAPMTRHLVCEEGGTARRPKGLILIRQS